MFLRVIYLTEIMEYPPDEATTNLNELLAGEDIIPIDKEDAKLLEGQYIFEQGTLDLDDVRGHLRVDDCGMVLEVLFYSTEESALIQGPEDHFLRMLDRYRSKIINFNGRPIIFKRRAIQRSGKPL